MVKAGDTLTAHAGNWEPSGPTHKYQWYASGQAISRLSAVRGAVRADMEMYLHNGLRWTTTLH